MSKTAGRRVALLASSSLGLAAIASAASLGVALAPTAAAAQASCTSGTAITNNNSNDVTIAGGTNNPGITCTYAGDDAMVSTAAATTVSTVAPGGGINLSATGTSDVNWTSTAGTVTGGAQTNGPVIDALTAAGDITLLTGQVNGSGATVSHGVRAISTGGGSIHIGFTGGITGTPATSQPAAATAVGIEAVSTGGNGDVSIVHTASFSVTGRLYGIVAEASGSGDLTIELRGSTVAGLGSNQAFRTSTGSLAGGAGIHATTDKGLLTIYGQGTNNAGTGVIIDAGGDVVFTGKGVGGQYGIDVVNVANGTSTTLNLAGDNSVIGGIAGIRAAGSGDLLVNIVGEQRALNFDFTAMTKTVEVVVVPWAAQQGGAWRPAAGATIVPDTNNFTVRIAEGGALIQGHELGGAANADVLEPATEITFASGDAVFTNEGTIVVGWTQLPSGAGGTMGPEGHEAELRLLGVSEFRHSGSIMLGSRPTGAGLDRRFGANKIVVATDGVPDDIFTLVGGTWVGEGGEVIFDVDTGASQANCDRAPITNSMAAADCVRIIDGATEGVTYVTLVERFPGDRGRFSPDGIVLVETPGTTSAQGHFVVGPNSPGWSPEFGGSLDKGFFQYVMAYDEDAEHHKLVGLLGSNAYQFPLYAAAAHSLWRTSTGTWLERQADLRRDVEGGVGGGVWLRASAERANRDVANSSEAAGQTFAFDNTHEQRSYAVTGGLDLISALEGDSAFVVGVMAGYAHADLEYDASPNVQAMDAWTAGAYASFISGGMFVDAALNANNVILDNDTPAFNFFPEGSILSSRLMSVGVQVEGGWRIPFEGGLFVEPLAGVSYVRSSYDDVLIAPADPNRPGLVVAYDDPTSLRASIGGRLGLDGEFGLMRTQLSILGRVWNEFEGENTVIVHNAAFADDPDVLVTDDFSGRFNEFGVGASIWSPGGAVTGFFNFGGKFGDDYSSQTGSVGVRVNW